MRNQRPDRCINDGNPDQIARDAERVTEQREWGSVGETPQDYDEGAERQHGTEQPSDEGQGARDE
jgi:hypothetical protein